MLISFEVLQYFKCNRLKTLPSFLFLRKSSLKILKYGQISRTASKNY